VVKNYAISPKILYSRYGDFGENFGGRAHQKEAKISRQSAVIRDYTWEKKIKSTNEVSKLQLCIQVKFE
jgi:hypothetical protein